MKQDASLQQVGESFLIEMHNQATTLSSQSNGLVNINLWFEEYITKVEYFSHREQIETLVKVINDYATDKVSLNVLQWYLETQFAIHKEKEFFEGLKLSNTECMKQYSEKSQASPKISVIITTYNRKQFLKQAVNSVLKQNYSNKEIIIIDDCSTDGTEFLVQKYFGNDDQRVIYMRNKVNCGPGANRRRAFAAHADGTYIHFLDDDDYLIDPDYYTKAIHFHEKYPQISFVAANVFMEHTDTQKLVISDLGLNELIPRYQYFINFEQAGFPKPISTLTTIFKRQALIDMGILEMNMVNDASIYLRSLLVGDAGFIDCLAGVYRIHSNNITFHLSGDFIIENLKEKMAIRNTAIKDHGYNAQEMNKWFDENAYGTISYYLSNSAKSYRDYKYMYEWVKKHSPKGYSLLKKKHNKIYIKRQLLRLSIVRKLLKK